MAMYEKNSTKADKKKPKKLSKNDLYRKSNKSQDRKMNPGRDS